MEDIASVSPGQAHRITKAAAVTSHMIEHAKAIHSKHFHDDSSPEILPAIIQALASNYMASIQASKD
jgi:hypothetical protein